MIPSMRTAILDGSLSTRMLLVRSRKYAEGPRPTNNNTIYGVIIEDLDNDRMPQATRSRQILKVYTPWELQVADHRFYADRIFVKPDIDAGDPFQNVECYIVDSVDFRLPGGNIYVATLRYEPKAPPWMLPTPTW